MDKRIKYNFKEKVKVVRSILSGQEGISSAALKLGAHRKTVQCWIGLYKHHGEAKLKDRSASYSGKFKLEVITYMKKNRLSLIEAAAFFGIPSDYTLRCWVKKYEQEGQIGLLQARRGRKRSLMNKKAKSDKRVSTDSIEKRLAALESENEYLRAENAYLKKLDALILEQKAAQKQSSQQKPSGN